jgi:hypothetical protein
MFEPTADFGHKVMRVIYRVTYRRPFDRGKGSPGTAPDTVPSFEEEAWTIWKSSLV